MRMCSCLNVFMRLKADLMTTRINHAFVCGFAFLLRSKSMNAAEFPRITHITVEFHCHVFRYANSLELTYSKQ